MRPKTKFALTLIAGLVVAWIGVGSLFYLSIGSATKPSSTRSDAGSHYAPSGLPLMVCEYRASIGIRGTEKFVNCRPAKILEGFGSKHIYGLLSE